ncbi:wings apart-like protein 2 [Macadamia integrifolia]|uniref:wings apart-like protein 2 n=1 Tax=Macadamia integrifolia TaxID=60698 RepID=UPI001C52D90F|nr:wings apart-like protein 2 [Macadamia integrifolia]
MIVRTYARRNRCISRSYSDSGFDGGLDDSFREPLSQENSQEICSFAFSSQDSSPWSFDSDGFNFNSSQGSFSALPPRIPAGDSSSQGNGVVRESKKQIIARKSGEIKKNKSSISKGVRSLSVPATSTLMEAQEFGEMMEHVDEVNFALDGLRKIQPSSIRRASLLSLLSICSTAPQRRLLRAQGTAKTVIDSILGIRFDDSPSTLAAAALFYILASDGQDDHLLDSPTCIHFLLKLLKPPVTDTRVEKAPTIGSKLLALHKDPGVLGNTAKILDSTSSAIFFKVRELLLSCKEIKVRNVDNDGMNRPELSPKWIALLTMEKACLSAVSLEDTSGSVRKIGGNFKEKLREFGGLDAVVDVAANCHSIMEGWSPSSLSSIWELKDDVAKQNLVFLLKCLKIMENATFLSKDNQNHLLGVDRNLDRGGSVLSFAGLILSVIKILSGLSLLQSSSTLSSDEKQHSFSEGMDHASEISLKEDEKGDRNGSLSYSSIGCCSSEQATNVKGFKVPKKRQRLSSSSQSRVSASSFEATTACSIKKGENSSTSGSLFGRLRNSHGGIVGNADGLKMNAVSTKRPNVTEDINDGSLEGSQDPFAFDEDEWKPSTWDLLSKRKNVSPTQKSRLAIREPEEGCETLLRTSHRESSNSENHYSCEPSCSSSAEKENSELLDDCLLTAVKVLMNLTNDNPVGCQQIAACGGLETMSDLIICHFPSFSSCLSPHSQFEENVLSSIELGRPNDRHLTDQELDFLVAILGLLVNLVEKDSRNRSRLAAANIALPGSRGSKGKESCRDVIQLLCTIFLANQGAGEAVGDGRALPWDDEDAVEQGEREAEKMIIEAYSALLLAFLSTASESAREAIASCLPDYNLEVLVPVLERFVAFHLTLNMISPETHKVVSEVIESCRGP